MFWIPFVITGLVPPSVVPIHRSIHAAFPVSIGRDILFRWMPDLELQDIVSYTSMLQAFEEPNTSCVCQYHTGRGLIVFAIKTDLTKELNILAHMRHPESGGAANGNAIQDLHDWFEDVK